jgi:hypothetical protein
MNISREFRGEKGEKGGSGENLRKNRIDEISAADLLLAVAARCRHHSRRGRRRY